MPNYIDMNHNKRKVERLYEDAETFEEAFKRGVADAIDAYDDLGREDITSIDVYRRYSGHWAAEIILVAEEFRGNDADHD